MKDDFLISYYSELQNYFLSGGKRIRPLLTIATYNAFKRERDEKVLIPSIGIEFLHNASLIHDDIIDKDNFRRGNPAFHYRFQNYHKKYSLQKMDAVDFGNSIGIIGGDTAFLMGLEAYFFNDFATDLNLKAASLYEQAFIEIADGVLIEMDMVNREELTIDDYINMISLKTGALIEKSLLIGANYANVKEANVKLLSNYGINLGIVFQMIDDILGTFGDEKVTGKPTDGDIREGKKTCLLIEAYEKLNDKKKEQLNELIQNQNMTKNDVQKVKELFLEAEVVDSCKEISSNYFHKAKNALDDLKKVIEPSEAEFFESLLNFVMNRDY